MRRKICVLRTGWLFLYLPCRSSERCRALRASTDVEPGCERGTQHRGVDTPGDAGATALSRGCRVRSIKQNSKTNFCVPEARPPLCPVLQQCVLGVGGPVIPGTMLKQMHKDRLGGRSGAPTRCQIFP